MPTVGVTSNIVLGTAVLCGASLQRLSGVGFGLVAGPVLALVLGPGPGVLVSNLGSCTISSVGMLRTWRRVMLGAMLPLVAAAAVTVPCGAWVSTHLPERFLLCTIGGVVVTAVLLVAVGVRVRALRGRAGAATAGALSGFMNATAGAGGPPLSLYAANAGWTAARFVPNSQFYAVTVNAFSLAAKGPPHLTAPGWLACAAGITGGAALGGALAGRVPDAAVRRLVLAIAFLGGVMTVLRGTVLR